MAQPSGDHVHISELSLVDLHDATLLTIALDWPSRTVVFNFRTSRFGTVQLPVFDCTDSLRQDTTIGGPALRSCPRFHRPGSDEWPAYRDAIRRSDGTLADGECTLSGWGSGSSDTSERVSAGEIEVLLDGVPITDLGEFPWVPGARFGARATGDIFPAFDVPDAGGLPAPLVLAPPTAIDPLADLELSWDGPCSDWAYVSLSTVDVDWGQRLSCTFVDDGSATVPSRELQGLWGSFRDLGYMATTLSRGTTWSGEDVCTCE